MQERGRPEPDGHPEWPITARDGGEGLCSGGDGGYDQRVERDDWIRLFNRLEAAVSHHKRATVAFTTDADDAPYAARDRILRDAVENTAPARCTVFHDDGPVSI